MPTAKPVGSASFDELRLSLNPWDEAITDACLGLDQIGLFQVRTQFVTQLPHEDAQILQVFGLGGSPDRCQNLTVRDAAFGVPSEDGQ